MVEYNLYMKIFLKPEKEHFTLIYNAHVYYPENLKFYITQNKFKLGRIIKSTKSVLNSEETNFKWIIIKSHLKLSSLFTELFIQSVNSGVVDMCLIRCYS